MAIIIAEVASTGATAESEGSQQSLKIARTQLLHFSSLACSRRTHSCLCGGDGTDGADVVSWRGRAEDVCACTVWRSLARGHEPIPGIDTALGCCAVPRYGYWACRSPALLEPIDLVRELLYDLLLRRSRLLEVLVRLA
jgi:hypothetical protein